MKLMIGDYEVEIKARSRFGGKERYNKQDTMYFLNTLSLVFAEAGERNEMIHNWDMEYKKISHEIYKVLDKNGLYNEFR